MFDKIKEKLGDDFDFESIEVFGVKMLISIARLDSGEWNIKNMLPEGLYMYAVRHTDDDYMLAEINNKVLVNFAGNILSNVKIDIGDGILLRDDDYSFTDDDPLNFEDIVKYVNDDNKGIDIIDSVFIDNYRLCQ